MQLVINILLRDFDCFPVALGTMKSLFSVNIHAKENEECIVFDMKTFCIFPHGCFAYFL